ncbi:MAG: Cys-tRNA(Pro) deacylase [Gammaproteobacteria bacterium]|nr:Cys-tRNA(Pro) deacylase [Gammaproteobacteria bacterium]
MTPAVNAANKQGITFNIHEYRHDPANQAYGVEAAEKLGISADQVFKTLVVILDNGHLAVAVIPVSQQLNLKRFAKAIGCKKVQMADKAAVERSTGYILGGVSPLGQKKRLMTLLDRSAKMFETIFVSAGRRGLEIELSPADLISITGGSLHEIC